MGFNFTVLEPSDNPEVNPLPLKIKIGGYVESWSKNLDIVLSRLAGENAYIKSKIWRINGARKNATQRRDGLVN
jgi:hypothetical protein